MSRQPMPPPSRANQRAWARTRAYGRALSELRDAYPVEFRAALDRHFEACLLEEQESVDQGIADGIYAAPKEGS